MDLASLRRLIAYNEWANARLLGAVAGLTADQWTRNLTGSFASIRETFAHLVAVEWVWLRRWHGESPRTLPDWAVTPDVQSLVAKLAEIERDRAVFVRELAEADLDRRVAYTNFKGERWEYALRDLFIHLVNHSTYHRGQIATMCRQVGASAPATDFLVYEDGPAR
jgi:uncharacterized damage-inducible protein DinB